MGRGLFLKTPILASPMDTISESKMASSLSSAGGAAVIHRYNSISDQAHMIMLAKELEPEGLTLGAAVGVSGDYLNRAAVVNALDIDFICVDVAHGHHISMREALSALRTLLGDEVHIMAGNVATLAGVNDLADWGADSVRCNIGGGSICSTRIQTGHGIPGLQTILDCAQTDRDVKIIADGGIRNSGDMVKAFAAGADVVMCGSLFAGTFESPGEVMEDQTGRKWKIYRGMASKEAQIDWRGKYSSFEGVSSRVPYRGSVGEIVEDLCRGIKSGFSYSGARNLAEFQAKAKFIMQTSAGQSESSAHIMSRDWK
jgi:IMP dehydrogenase